MSHPHTFQVMQTQSGTSSVLNNTSNHDLKDNRVLVTLIFITEGYNFIQSYIRKSLSRPLIFHIWKHPSGTSSILNNLSDHDLMEKEVIKTIIFITEA